MSGPFCALSAVGRMSGRSVQCTLCHMSHRESDNFKVYQIEEHKRAIQESIPTNPYQLTACLDSEL